MNDLLADAPWGHLAMLIVLLWLLLWLTAHLAGQKSRHAALHEADLRRRCQDQHEFIRGKCAGIRECADWMHEHGYLPRRVALPASLLEPKPTNPKPSAN